MLRLNVPADMFLSSFDDRLLNRHPMLSSHVSSCVLYSAIGGDFATADNLSNAGYNDGYDAEPYIEDIVFFVVDLTEKDFCDVLVKCMLKAVNAGTVIILRCNGEISLATGLPGQAREIFDNLKIMEYCMTPWLSEQESKRRYPIDFSIVKQGNLEIIYEQIYHILSEVTRDNPAGNLHHAVMYF